MSISNRIHTPRHRTGVLILLIMFCLTLAPAKGFCKVTRVSVPPDTRREILRLIRSSDPLSMDESEASWLKDALDNYAPSLGNHWQSILDFWRYVNTDMPVNIGTLPPDLPQTNRLCLIVLGYQLNPKGTMKDELIGRLETALKCAEQYPEAVILCTGGPTASSNPDTSEAKEMAKWLKKHGVSSDRIIMEGQSLSTSKNASYSYRVLRKKAPQVDSVAIISSEYHIAWGSVMFESQFLLAADAEDGQIIHVVSNAAFDTEEHIGTFFPFHGGIGDLIRMNNIESRYFK